VTKTKVWGSSNQHDIKINPRRMEHFIPVDLRCHLWREPGGSWENATGFRASHREKVMLTNAVDTNAWLSGDMPKWRGGADRRHSNLRPAPPSRAVSSFKVREELLARLLVDEQESLNRLYNFVSQVGLRILFFDENERFVGRYDGATKSDYQSTYSEPTFNGCSADEAKSSLAAPIFDTTGALLGFLDASPTKGDFSGDASILAHVVLRSTARAIEERSFRKQYRREWIVALATPESAGRGILLAVDGQQRIVGADRAARSTVCAHHVYPTSGTTLWALFETDAVLFRNRNIGDVHATLVDLKSAEVWTAIITPPESDAVHNLRADYTTLHYRPRLDSIGYFRRSELPVSSVGGLTPRALQRIRNYVEEHLVENIELAMLANIAGLSKWHFHRAFKRSAGITPHFYLIRRRLENAQRLLAETDLSLAQIALKSGFSDQSHFSRSFRMLFGVTPTFFRRSKR
jgi:AraC-like DNA-binding protein